MDRQKKLRPVDDVDLPDVPVRGYRADWLYRIIGNFELLKTEPQRAAYMNALYVLRMESLPPAYDRNPDVVNFQRGINTALARMEESYQDDADYSERHNWYAETPAF